jgi:3-deoxy-D-manno-octulosonic-acid transferase
MQALPAIIRRHGKEGKVALRPGLEEDFSARQVNRPRMMLLYSLAVTLALVLSAPVWGWRMLRQGRYRQGLRQRLGDVPQRLKDFVQGRPVVWVHAVSVGETLTAARLIAELEAALPGYAVVISTTTPTGQQVARERFGVDRVFFYPLDLAFAVRPYLHTLQPKLVVLMESELWPRMLVECERANVPVAVVNARVSDRSLPRYMALRRLWQPLLGKLSLLLAQSDEDARRWRATGAPAERVHSTGNLKYDVRIATARIRARSQSCWIAGAQIAGMSRQ